MNIINRKNQLKLLLILPALMVLAVPLVVTNEYFLKIINNIILYSIISLSVNLIVGFCGQLDFGRSAFAGIGCYFAAVTMVKLHVPFLIAFLGAGLFAAFMGMLLGMLCRKTSFDYLTLITIGFSEICRLIFMNWNDVTGGAVGLMNVPAPDIFGLVFDTHAKFFYFALALLVLSYVVIKRITKSKLGRAFEAIRDDSIAASYSGINVPNYKILCFALGSFFTGLAGAAMVSYTQYASPYNFTIDESLVMLQMAILGGLGSLPGSIIGAAILIITPELSRDIFQYRLLIMGTLMVILMLFAPNGLLGKNGVGDKVIGFAHIRIKKNKKKQQECGENK